MRSLPGLPLFAFLMLGFSHATAAPVIKCRADDGGISYQDSACKTGIELRNFDTDPPTLSVVPGLPPTAIPKAAAQRTRGSQPATRAPTKQRAGVGRAAERRFIRSGMTEAEVVRRIGKPELDARASRKQTSRKQASEGKHWSYLPAPGDPQTITTLTIVGGLVANVERKVVR
jgi:hypothetical protein